MGFFPQVFSPKTYIHLSSPPYMLHSTPISFFSTWSSGCNIFTSCYKSVSTTQFLCILVYLMSCSSHGATAPSEPGPHYRGFMITLRHTTLGMTPLNEWSARRIDLYLTTHRTHKKQTSMTSAGFEPAIPESERPQTLALDRAATGFGI